MATYLNALIFGIYPYVALIVLAVGTVWRYEREPYTWRSGSSQLLRRKQLIWGSVLFHAGVLVVFFGHLFGDLALDVGLLNSRRFKIANLLQHLFILVQIERAPGDFHQMVGHQLLDQLRV
jgi:hypothetical protein